MPCQPLGRPLEQLLATHLSERMPDMSDVMCTLHCFKQRCTQQSNKPTHQNDTRSAESNMIQNELPLPSCCRSPGIRRMQIEEGSSFLVTSHLVWLVAFGPERGDQCRSTGLRRKRDGELMEKKERWRKRERERERGEHAAHTKSGGVMGVVVTGKLGQNFLGMALPRDTNKFIVKKNETKKV